MRKRGIDQNLIPTHIFKGFKNTSKISYFKRGEKMIGAVIFVIVFVLFVLIGLAGMSLPPGDWLIQEYIPDILQTEYASLAEGIINGVIYGIIVWIVFSIAMMIYEKIRGPKEVIVKVEK